MGGGSSIPTPSIIDEKNIRYRCRPFNMDDCPVCLEHDILFVGDKCKHGICSNCLDKLDNKCPLCRGSIINGITMRQHKTQLMLALEEAGIIQIEDFSDFSEWLVSINC